MKKTGVIIGVSLLLLLILAAGAYTAVGLLAAQGEPATAAGGGRVMESVEVNNDGAPVSVRTTILPAPELPAAASAAFGVFIERNDNGILIGTGNIELDVEVQVDGATGQSTTAVVPSTSGPELEVVVSHDTIVYRDVTDLASDQPTESGEREVQQVVKEVESADEIGENTEIEVWGERRGDRIIAEVIVFGPLGGGSLE